MSGTISDRAAAGGAKALMVRPEAVSVSRTRAELPAGANAVHATVRDVEFLGSYRTLVLGLGDAEVQGLARIPASDNTVAAGDRVTAWWLPASQRVVAV